MVTTLRLHPFDLRLRHTFRISREAMDVQPTLIVELERDGVCGYGEATANNYYGFTIERMTADLLSMQQDLAAFAWTEPGELWRWASGRLKDNSFALCALDLAAHDLWGKLRGKPVWKLWGLTLDRLPVSNYTIGIDSLEVMEAKLREFADWPIFKIKLGTSRDLEIVRHLRSITSALFRVDANCGWSAEETIRNSAELKQLGVEFIEQPLPDAARDQMPAVRQASALPIIADESCITEADVERCAGQFDGINIKLVKCGGLTPARRMIARARELNLQVMVGCMTESSVGISAIAQLLPLLDYVDMDGAVLLAEDIASGVRLERGKCIYPDLPGCGVVLHGMP